MGEPMPYWMQNYIELAEKAEVLFHKKNKTESEINQLNILLKEIDGIVKSKQDSFYPTSQDD